MDGSVGIALDKIRMLLQKYCCGSAVVVHQIQYDTESQTMGFFDEIPKVSVRSILRVHMEIVLDAVGIFGVFQAAFDLTVAPVFRPGVVVLPENRAEVNNVHPQAADVLQQPGGRRKCSLRRKGPQKQLIKNRSADFVACFHG